MPLSHLEHLLVLANDLEETKDWYVRVLGLEQAQRFVTGFDGKRVATSISAERD